jgi:hypothetical protein
MLPQRVGDDPQMLLFPDMPSASSANEANFCTRPGDGQVSRPFTSWPNDKVPDDGRQHREFDRRIDSRAEELLGTVHSPALHAKGKQHEGGERRPFEVSSATNGLSAGMQNTASMPRIKILPLIIIQLRRSAVAAANIAVIFGPKRRNIAGKYEPDHNGSSCGG